MAMCIPPRELPVVVISSGDQPPEQIAAHRALAESSFAGRHVTAVRSGHWVQFDEPEVVVSVVREMVESQRSAERGPQICEGRSVH